jgi:hypothetical protein
MKVHAIAGVNMATRKKHHKPHETDLGEDDPEPGQLPVEPDEGPVLPFIPEDPEHDRVVDPEARLNASPDDDPSRTQFQRSDRPLDAPTPRAEG